MSAESSTKIDYLYQEYVRLNNKAEELITSIFDDFKLFGAVGASIALWKPILDLFSPKNITINSEFALLLGFISLLIALYLVAYLGLNKMGYLLYYVQILQTYELRIKRELNESDSSDFFIFNLGRAGKNFATSFRLSFRAFLICFGLISNIIPTIILCSYNAIYALIYFLLAAISGLIYLLICIRIFRQYSRANYL